MKKIAFALVALSLVSEPAMAEVCFGKTCFGSKETKKSAEKKAGAQKIDKLGGDGKPAHVTIYKPREAKAANKNAKATYKRIAGKSRHDMANIRFTGNPDVDFARSLLPYLQNTRDLAKAELKYGKDPVLKELAARTVVWQEADIGRMTQWLSGRDSYWRADGVNTLPSVKTARDTATALRRGLVLKYSGNPDLDFARLMVPHHQAAAELAAIEKVSGTDKAMRAMADDLYRSHSRQLQLINEWLATQKPTKK